MSEIIKLNLTNDDIIEQALDLFVQCVNFKVEDNLQDTFITLKMNVMGIIYSVQVPKHEIDKQNIDDAWKQLIQDFATFHLLGQNKRVIDGHRELTEEEQRAIEEKR